MQTAWPSALILLALAACRLPPAPVVEPEPDLPAPPPAMEVRYVEASGPPQDPTRVAPAPAPAAQPEDPHDPAVVAEELRRELEREQERRRLAEREVEKHQTRIHELEARVLSLSLERARMEQEVLQLRIEALRAQLAELEPAPASDAAPAGDR